MLMRLYLEEYKVLSCMNTDQAISPKDQYFLNSNDYSDHLGNEHYYKHDHRKYSLFRSSDENPKCIISVFPGSSILGETVVNH